MLDNEWSHTSTYEHMGRIVPEPDARSCVTKVAERRLAAIKTSGAAGSLLTMIEVGACWAPELSRW
jgi:hypothetical protein